MVTEDFEHLAQVLVSVHAQVKFGNFPENEFDRLIVRVLWAIQSSPGGSPQFDSDAFSDFIKRARGEPVDAHR